jgi:single stranded DNA-binding protein
MKKKVTLLGSLGSDAKVIEVSGYYALSFDLAVTERHKDSTGTWGNLTEWFKVMKWDKKEYVEKSLPYFKKGSKVLVDGSFTLTSFKDKPQMTVRVSEMELISSPTKS